MGGGGSRQGTWPIRDCVSGEFVSFIVRKGPVSAWGSSGTELWQMQTDPEVSQGQDACRRECWSLRAGADRPSHRGRQISPDTAAS